MKVAPETPKQNITLRLDRRTLRKAKVLAARRNTSIRGLLAEQIEALVGEDDAKAVLRELVAVAMRSGARRVLSEDLNPGQVIAGVTIQNPFAD